MIDSGNVIVHSSNFVWDCPLHLIYFVCGAVRGLLERRKGRSLWFFTVYRRRLNGGEYRANVRSGAGKVNLPGGGNNALFANLCKNLVVFLFFYAIMTECNTTRKEMEEYEW